MGRSTRTGARRAEDVSPPSPHDWALQQHPRLTSEARWTSPGSTVWWAREHVIEEMKRLGHFEGVEDRKIPMKHSDRSKTPIEPYLSEQWFVKMDDWSDGRPGLAQSALDAVNDGRVKFFHSGTRRPTSTGWERSGIGVSPGSLCGDIGFRCGRSIWRAWIPPCHPLENSFSESCCDGGAISNTDRSIFESTRIHDQFCIILH